MDTAQKAKIAKEASFRLQTARKDEKNEIISLVAKLLFERKDLIIAENRKDMERSKKEELAPVLLKRLVLTEQKIDSMIESLNEVVAIEDPTGILLSRVELDEGLVLDKVTVPIGVIGIIFESRPDALVQISSLCIKSGNAAILKGGSEALCSNKALFALFEEAIRKVSPLFEGCLQLATSREDIKNLLVLDEYVDLMIPRGGNDLVKYIKNNTRIPVLGHADGICHLYVDKSAEMEMALNVTKDSKCQYAAVCNALETLLVHEDVAGDFLARLSSQLEGVEIRGDEKTRSIIDVKAADDSDWVTEYNDLILSVKVVSSMDEAIDHINTYGSHHTDTIVTSDEAAANRFLDSVDSSSVMWNCSTRFADGFRYGLGAEVGISTNKIHARGPVGLEGLVTYKYKLVGHGQVVGDYADGKKHFTHKILK